jgi:PAS domain S-box-containing protein
VRGSYTMAQAKPTSKRSREAGKTKEEKLRLNEHALREAHAQVARSEEYWRSVFENSVVGVALIDFNGQFFATNPAYQAMLGYTEEELHQLRFLDITLEEYRDHNWALVEELLAGKRQRFQIENQHRRKNGSLVWVRNNISLVPGTEQVPRFVMVFSDDITERKQAEEHWQRSEAFLADGQHLSKTGTFSWSIEKNEVTWSEELYSIFDFEPGLPVTLEMIGSRVHAEDLPMLEDMIARAQRGKDQFEYEHRIVVPDGSIKYIHLVGHTVHNVEDRLEYIGAAQDVTQRRVAEEQLRDRELNLRRITQTIPGMLWSGTPDGAVDYCNRPWLDFTAMTTEQAQGWGWATAIHPDDRNALIESWRSCLTSGLPFDAEARLRRSDGAYRWFLFRANPLRDESERIVKWYGTNLDIEDRKQGEEDLRARELSWRQIVDNIPGFVHTTSASGEVEFINRQTQEYFGKTNEELKDWSRIDIVHPDDLPRVIEAWRASVETGQTYEVEQRNRGADGVYRWFQSRGRAVRNPKGEITAWYWLNTDIEDRKRAEEALQLNERNLSLIINTMPTLVWSARPDGSAEFFNQHYLDYVGLPLEKLQGWGWAVAIHPDDLKALSGVWQSIMAAGKPGEAEARLRRFDGEYRWFLFRSNPMLNESGEIVKWYGTNTDINDRKRAEAEVRESYLRLAEAQQLSKTGSFITDLLADDHNWSEETFRIFEFDPRTKVTVQMIRDMIHPDDLPSFDSTIARAMTGEDVEFSFRFVTSRGNVKHIRGLAHVIEHIVGRPLFIGALQDVTDSKVAEEALNRARSELAHVARVSTLNALTASIAHEINQPLSGIITNANTCLWLLSTDPPDIAGAQEASQRTIRDGNRASDVIKRLRTLYSNRGTRLEAMDLNEATREVVSLALSDLQRNRVIVRHELADDLPPITGDRVQLQQVILNLLRNASEAMSTVDDRPRELLIKTERDEGNRIYLRVKDAGVGFQPQDAERLFEAFYTTKDDGVGIGLHVSRSIIDAHHGRLWATANDGSGATFSFAIPSSPEALTGAATPVNRADNTTDQD